DRGERCSGQQQASAVTGPRWLTCPIGLRRPGPAWRLARDRRITCHLVGRIAAEAGRARELGRRAHLPGRQATCALGWRSGDLRWQVTARPAGIGPGQPASPRFHGAQLSQDLVWCGPLLWLLAEALLDQWPHGA